MIAAAYISHSKVHDSDFAYIAILLYGDTRELLYRPKNKKINVKIPDGMKYM